MIVSRGLGRGPNRGSLVAWGLARFPPLGGDRTAYGTRLTAQVSLLPGWAYGEGGGVDAAAYGVLLTALAGLRGGQGRNWLPNLHPTVLYVLEPHSELLAASPATSVDDQPSGTVIWDRYPSSFLWYLPDLPTQPLSTEWPSTGVFVDLDQSVLIEQHPLTYVRYWGQQAEDITRTTVYNRESVTTVYDRTSVTMVAYRECVADQLDTA